MEQVVAVRRGPGVMVAAVGAAQSTDIVRLFVDRSPVIAAPLTDNLVRPSWVARIDASRATSRR